MHSLSALAVPFLLLVVPLCGIVKKQPVYEQFVSGAAEGLTMTLQIFPYLLAMMLSVAVFRASGAFAALSDLLSQVTDAVGIPVSVLPLALLRPLSGSGSLAMCADIVNEAGPDSFPGLLASVMQGSTDTTFYVLAVYFGSVGITKYRYALIVGLSADLLSFIASYAVCRVCFG
ncbi:MAG: spore maturation protein [Firmicutes bacterium]|nr:spore maturation protein [Bacillota bacterium]